MSTPLFTPALRADGGPQTAVGGAEQELEVERASASPRGKKDAPAAAPSQPVGTIEGAVSGPLAELQSWFSEVMRHPVSAAAGIEAAAPLQAALGAERAEQIVQPSRRLSATQRMQIYNHAYHSRLVGCVKQDFEVLGHALGAQRFDEVCGAYVRAHPSTSPNLNVYAEGFGAFVATQQGLGVDAGFLADLARLEWSMIEVMHAPAAPAMDMTALQSAPPERWANLRLFQSPSLRFERFDYPVNAYLQAVFTDKDPEIPTAQASATAIYRQDWRIWRMDFTATTASVLQALLDGQPLGDALSVLAQPGVQPDGADVMKWFQEWLSSGFFSGYEI